MQPCSEATTISPDRNAMEVLSLMTRTQNSRLLVIEGDRVVGIVILMDVLNLLNVKLNLEKAEGSRSPLRGRQYPGDGSGAGSGPGMTRGPAHGSTSRRTCYEPRQRRAGCRNSGGQLSSDAEGGRSGRR